MESLKSIESMAHDASKNGFRLRLERMANGGHEYAWERGGVVFEAGKTTADTKPVAFVLALKAIYG